MIAKEFQSFKPDLKHMKIIVHKKKNKPHNSAPYEETCCDRLWWI